MYFSENSNLLKINEGVLPNSGLRRGQVGALHSLAANLIERHEPLIVSLPTGYGKTAVITATGFLAKARRILFVTPTAALRKQGAQAFRSMATLKRLGCLPEDALTPIVKIIESQVTSTEEWETYRDADVVVCTPNSASPEFPGIPAPPDDLFDLVLIDEGHHSPAKTWAAMIRGVHNANHILFTATPFRRDRRQIPGRLIFNYSLRKAVEESAFGRVTFEPVVVELASLEQTKNAALIARAVEIFRRDQAAGFEHRLFARTDRIAAAEELAEQYVAAGLRVAAVSSRKSRTHIAEIEQKLESGELDGIVCVDMFGEGYDFPRFKIAVLHSAHKSLVPTLQFIGRFARTNDQHTGDATFIAIPREVDTESIGLYREGVDWDVLLANVVEARQQLALQERETLLAFAQTANPSADYESVNPGSFRLSQHLACYRVQAAPDFSQPPETLKALQVTNSWKSEDGTTCLILAKSVKKPAWYLEEHLIDAQHECFLLKHFPDSGTLFITATERSERFYAEIIDFFFDGKAMSLSLEQVRKVLNGMTDQVFYNIGIRNLSPTTTAESYRIVTGSSADRGIRETDAVNFSQGHFMGKGLTDGEAEVIGASAGGRVWSSGKLSIPETLEWMEELHARITANEINIGRSGLDLLTFGETLDRIPENTCMADWSRETYKDDPHVYIYQGANLVKTTCILDLEIRTISVAPDGTQLTFQIGDDSFAKNIVYYLRQHPQYVSNSAFQFEVAVRGSNPVPIEEWLEDNQLRFFTQDLDSFERSTLQRRPLRTDVRPESLLADNWTGCETTVEFDQENPGRQTVQRFLANALLALPDISFVVHDHRSGEAADFIVAKELPTGKLEISLYHCKGAGGEVPSGERVGDVYELAGQSIKSVRFQGKEQLLKHLERRTLARPGGGHSPFLFGERTAALELIEQYEPIDLVLVVYAVQPGLSAGNLNENVRRIMAAANDSLASQNVTLRWKISE